MYKGIKAYIEHFGQNFKGFQRIEESEKTEEEALDHFIALFQQAWTLLTDLTNSYGSGFTIAERDRLQCLEIELGLLKEEILQGLAQ